MEDYGTANRTRWSIAPYVIVDDVVNTANFFRDKLGFGYERFWGERPSFCMVARNGIIMLAQLERPDSIRPNHIVDPEARAWDAYIWVDVQVERGKDRTRSV